jgi:hypothetical protein
VLSVLRVTNSDYPLGIFKLSYTVFGTSHTFLLLYPCRILLSYRVGRFISSVSPFWYSFKNQNVKRFCPYLIAKCVIVVYRQVSSILAIFRTKKVYKQYVMLVISFDEKRQRGGWLDGLKEKEVLVGLYNFALPFQVLLYLHLIAINLLTINKDIVMGQRMDVLIYNSKRRNWTFCATTCHYQQDLANLLLFF